MGDKLGAVIKVIILGFTVFLLLIASTILGKNDDENSTDYVNTESNDTYNIIASNDELNVNIYMELDENNNIVMNRNGKTNVKIENNNEKAIKDMYVTFKLYDKQDKLLGEGDYTNWSCDGQSSKVLDIQPFKDIPEEYKVTVDFIHGFVQDGAVNISTPPPTDSSKLTDSEIWVYAQYAVKEQLKSPKSAKFPIINEATITRNNDSITVSAYVDADNSFGASIRNNFTVTLTADGNNVLEVNIYE